MNRYARMPARVFFGSSKPSSRMGVVLSEGSIGGTLKPRGVVGALHPPEQLPEPGFGVEAGVQGVEHGPGPGLHRAADDAGNIGANTVRRVSSLSRAAPDKPLTDASGVNP